MNTNGDRDKPVEALPIATRRSISIPELSLLRTTRPRQVENAKLVRKRPTLTDDRVLIIAADHPARGTLRAGDDPFALANRSDLLERLCLALSRPGVSGILGSPDIIDDLLLLGALEEKLVFGSMNRGGLAGTRFEIDDRFTAYNANSLVASRFEGGKMLLRIDPDDNCTADALEACAHAVTDLADHDLLTMIEPFLSHRIDGRVRNELTADAMIRAVSVASGLGPTSAFTWLKVPVVAEMERVLAATTLPTLILGGEVPQDLDSALALWSEALAHPTAHGLVVGRALLYPRNDDVTSAVDAAVKLLN